MVNENQGKTYNPVPIYNRKMVRDMLRSQIEARDGSHGNKYLKEYFNRYNVRCGRA